MTERPKIAQEFSSHTFPSAHDLVDYHISGLDLRRANANTIRRRPDDRGPGHGLRTQIAVLSRDLLRLQTLPHLSQPKCPDFRPVLKGIQPLPNSGESGYCSCGSDMDQRGQVVSNLVGSAMILVVVMAATLALALGSFRLASAIGAVAMIPIELGPGDRVIYFIELVSPKKGDRHKHMLAPRTSLGHLFRSDRKTLPSAAHTRPKRIASGVRQHRGRSSHWPSETSSRERHGLRWRVDDCSIHLAFSIPIEQRMEKSSTMYE